MTRMLLTLAILGTTAGSATSVTNSRIQAPPRDAHVVGREKPLFLGSAVVTATALPDVR